MAESDDKLIFGRYTREQCGLPPVITPAMRRRSFFVHAILLLFVVLMAGWLAGHAAARWRTMWLAELPARVMSAPAADRLDLLNRGRIYAASQPERPGLGNSLVVALSVLAEQAPRRMGYYGSAGALLDRLWDGKISDFRDPFAAAMTAAGVRAELEQYDQAFALLATADKRLADTPDSDQKRARRLLLVNMQSYLLATVPRGSGRNPEKSLHLAQLLLTSKDLLMPGFHTSDSAAFLDTLACAWNATGDGEKAKATQTLALGLAGTDGLDVYIRHFDEFVEAARNKPITGTLAGVF